MDHLFNERLREKISGLQHKADSAPKFIPLVSADNGTVTKEIHSWDIGRKSKPLNWRPKYVDFGLNDALQITENVVDYIEKNNPQSDFHHLMSKSFVSNHDFSSAQDNSSIVSSASVSSVILQNMNKDYSVPSALSSAVSTRRNSLGSISSISMESSFLDPVETDSKKSDRKPSQHRDRVDYPSYVENLARRLKHLLESPYYSTVLSDITSTNYLQADATFSKVDQVIRKFNDHLQSICECSGEEKNSLARSLVKSADVPLSEFPLSVITGNILCSIVEIAYKRVQEMSDLNEELKNRKQEAVLSLLSHQQSTPQFSPIKTIPSRHRESLQKSELQQQIDTAVAGPLPVKKTSPKRPMESYKAKKIEIEVERIKGIETKMQERQNKYLARNEKRLESLQEERKKKSEELEKTLKSKQGVTEMLDTNFRVESAVILSQKNERIDSQLARLEKEREIRNLQRHERDVIKGLEAEQKRKMIELRNKADSMKLQIKRDKIIVLMESKQKEVQEKIQKLHNTPYSNSIGSLSSPLEILPGPGAYDISSPLSATGGRLSKSHLPGVFDIRDRTPGPGHYSPQSPNTPSSNGAIPFMGRGKTDIDLEIHRAKQIPGPGQYDHSFSSSSSASIISSGSSEFLIPSSSSLGSPSLSSSKKKKVKE